MGKYMLTPPVVFLVVLTAMFLFSFLLSGFAFKKKRASEEGEKSYACGEDVPTHLMQPDYSQFFPFAFFFTVLHVVTLMVATVPIANIESFLIAAIYISGAMVGLIILFRR